MFKNYKFPESAAEYSIEVTKLLELTSDIEFANDFLSQFEKECEEVQSIVKLEIYENLLELSRYGNANLTNWSLRIFNRVFKNEKGKM